MSIRIIVSWLVLSVATSGLNAGDWSGLWRLVRWHEEKLDGIQHVLIPEGSLQDLRAFDETATPMNVIEARFDSDSLTLIVDQSRKQPLPLKFELHRSGGQVKGTWSFFHPQYGALQPEKVLGAKVLGKADGLHFEAFRALHQPGLIDLLETLHEPAAAGFTHFVQHWNDRLEPVYYFLLEDWLYGQGEDPDRKENRLRELFESLQAERDSESLIRQSSRLLREAYQNISSDYPSSIPALFVIHGPSNQSFGQRLFWSREMDAQAEQECACKLSLHERFLVVDPFQLPSDLETASLLIRKELILGFLNTPEPVTVVDEVFRQGLALYLARNPESEFQFELDPGSLDGHKAALAETAEQPLQDLDREWFRSLDPQELSPGYQVGLDFVEYLLTQHPLEQLKSLEKGQRDRHWRRYLDSRKAEL